MNIYQKTTENQHAGWRTHQPRTQSKELIDLGSARGWQFHIIGHAPMPSASFRIGDWLVVPATLDSSPIPVSAMQRIQAIHASGFEPKGYVLVHEAPKLLPAGETSRHGATARKPLISISPKRAESIRKGLKAAGGLLGTAALATGTIALGILAIVAIIPAVLLAGVVLLDPILVAVTEDNTWVEIDRWEV